jgi:hypothetical protein
MNSCFTLTSHDECVLYLLIFERERNFVGVLFSEVLSISLFHQCSLQMRHVSVETPLSIFTTNTSGQRRILIV